MMRRLLLIVVLVAAALATGYRIYQRELPRLQASQRARVIGAYHVHSSGSHDSSLSLDTITLAARRAGLSFVIVTDHNTQLAAPVVVNDIPVLSHAELSTPFGHLVQLGASPLLGHEQRQRFDVLREIRDLGGLPIAAHPADPKRPWVGPIANLAGFEITNFSSSARRRGGPVFVGLFPSLLAWPLNQQLALAQVYDRDDRALERWDAESDPSVIGLCALDEHGRFGSLEITFNAWHIVLHEQIPASPKERPDAVIQALRSGRFHCAAGLFGRDPHFRFFAEQEGRQQGESGDSLSWELVDDLIVEAPRASVATPVLVLYRNGHEVMRSHAGRIRYSAPSTGTYRAEVHLSIPEVVHGHRTVPIIYSNRIRIEAPSDPEQTVDGEALTSSPPEQGSESHPR